MPDQSTRWLVQTETYHGEWETFRCIGDDPAGLTLEQAKRRKGDSDSMRIVPVNAWYHEPVELGHSWLWGGPTPDRDAGVWFGVHEEVSDA